MRELGDANYTEPRQITGSYYAVAVANLENTKLVPLRVVVPPLDTLAPSSWAQFLEWEILFLPSQLLGLAISLPLCGTWSLPLGPPGQPLLISGWDCTTCIRIAWDTFFFFFKLYFALQYCIGFAGHLLKCRFLDHACVFNKLSEVLSQVLNFENN